MTRRTMARTPAAPVPQALRPVLIAGPTAVGKSAVALALARRLNGEIISVDAMQVYRGLDIGTAKPSPEERRPVPHHLIDVVELDKMFDAAQFTRLAQAAVAGIQERSRVPILCGGTGLYFKAFLEGLGEAPAASAGLRAELEATPLPELLRQLERGDPVTFANPWNPQAGTRNQERFFGLSRSGDDLGARINARVDAMFARGLVQETERLLGLGLEQNRTAMQAIGYRQVAELLRGERSLADTVALVKQRTRQFAKRQMNWFRRQFRLEWINLEPDVSADAVADGLRERI
ncbi:MAG: tRNA (adenosine(37)-N6)-dimethylallyltransferase MiaA [Verrucomicrobia bacterium]|nr:MAG: tRNA (adenosine(37)-N6)-dimethylallyltransferase MiaA [Verrucomicrobiota bacterium]